MIQCYCWQGAFSHSLINIKGLSESFDETFKELGKKGVSAFRDK